jgi:ABC-type multidrug transport system ATPase subunit
VSFDVHEGDRVGLGGDNGSGKTALLRTLAGIREPVNVPNSYTARGHKDLRETLTWGARIGPLDVPVPAPQRLTVGP